MSRKKRLLQLLVIALAAPLGMALLTCRPQSKPAMEGSRNVSDWLPDETVPRIDAERESGFEVIRGSESQLELESADSQD